MKALCWTGVNKVAVETVPDPQVLNADAVFVPALKFKARNADRGSPLSGRP